MRIKTNTLEIMTDEEYIANDTNLCPVCRSADILIEVGNFNGAMLLNACSCDKCNSVWEEEYVLVRYNLTKLADGGWINEG